MKSLNILFATIFLVSSFGSSALAAASESKTVSFTSERNFQKSADDEFDKILKAAFDLYSQKKLDDSLAAVAKAMALNPRDARPYALAGLIYLSQFKLKESSENFAKSIAINPTNKLVFLFKARADRFRNAREEAVAACRQALALDPQYAEAHLMLGDLLQYDDKTRDEAIKAYQTALKINPQLSEAAVQLGSLYAVMKNDKGAEELFRQSLEQDPQRMSGRFELGRLLVKQGRLKEARVLWDESPSREEKTFPNFITVLERAEKLEKAKEQLAQKSEDPETLVQMGLAVMDGDSWVVDMRQEKAIVYFKKALDLKPKFAAAQYAICQAYVQLADTFSDKKKNVDQEIAKLRQLDPKLADEMVEYRNNYSGGIKVSGPPPPAAVKQN